MKPKELLDQATVAFQDPVVLQQNIDQWRGCAEFLNAGAEGLAMTSPDHPFVQTFEEAAGACMAVAADLEKMVKDPEARKKASAMVAEAGRQIAELADPDAFAGEGQADMDGKGAT